MRWPAPVCWITHFEHKKVVSLSHKYLIFLFGCLVQQRGLGSYYTYE